MAALLRANGDCAPLDIEGENAALARTMSKATARTSVAPQEQTRSMASVNQFAFQMQTRWYALMQTAE
jgi:hypothetical protein